MKLNQLAAKPQLIKLTLDDAATIERHGEAIEFYTWDRQPLDVFMKLANITQNDSSEIINVVKDLILDEQGQQIIRDGVTIPTDVLVNVIAKITETLGK
jgi:hypothetical protein